MMNLTTGDPEFDPRKPLRINGYVFWPADLDDGELGLPEPICSRCGNSVNSDIHKGCLK